jgi:hypothetical protein
MGSRPFPEIPCVICKKPVDLQADLWADENGKATHADCYVKRIVSAQPAETWTTNLGDVRRQQLL